MWHWHPYQQEEIYRCCDTECILVPRKYSRISIFVKGHTFQRVIEKGRSFEYYGAKFGLRGWTRIKVIIVVNVIHKKKLQCFNLCACRSSESHLFSIIVTSMFHANICWLISFYKTLCFYGLLKKNVNLVLVNLVSAKQMTAFYRKCNT